MLNPYLEEILSNEGYYSTRETTRAIIDDNKNRLLGFFDIHLEDDKDLWAFPGGKLDPGEKPIDCLIRELKEEIGVTVSDENVTELHSKYYSELGRKLHIFYVNIGQQTPKNMEPLKAEDCEYKTLDELSKIDEDGLMTRDGKITIGVYRDFLMGAKDERII